MSNDTSQIRFPILPTSQYLTVLDEADNQVRAQLKEPDRKHYEVKAISVYPWWFTALILTALFVVLGLSFVVSAGKQAAAMGLILDPLPGRFNHLSEQWSNLSIAFMLALSELGTILFLIAGGTLTSRVGLINVGPLQLNPIKWLFRLFAMLCAAYSIVSNTTITALDLVHEAVVLQWLVTLGIPSVVLGLGIMLERMIIDSLSSRGEALATFRNARREYETYVANPRAHPSYDVILADMLFHEMVRVRAYQMLIKHLIETDPRYKGWLASAEHKTQQEAARIDHNISVETLIPAQVEMPRIESPRRVSKSVSRKPTETESEKATKWLVANPNHGLSSQKAADQAGVSKPTMYRAMMKQPKE